MRERQLISILTPSGMYCILFCRIHLQKWYNWIIYSFLSCIFSKVIIYGNTPNRFVWFIITENSNGNNLDSYSRYFSFYPAHNPISLNAPHASSMHLSIFSIEGLHRYSRHLSIFEVNSLFSLYCSCTSYNAVYKYAVTSPILKPSLYWSIDFCPGNGTDALSNPRKISASAPNLLVRPHLNTALIRYS